MDKYGSHICGYYQKVHLNKKRLYEEFGQLLDEINFISIQFRIGSTPINDGVDKGLQHRVGAFQSSPNDNLERSKLEPL